MGRERRVVGPSAAMPPHRFEVDLTSVCVRRGAVQLPFRLQGAFSEGPVAAVDNDGGATLDLRFRPPRELLGLQPFFEAHGLRANDRMGLVFTDAGLRVEAIKRERKAPASGVERPQASSPRGQRTPPPGSRDRSRRVPEDARRDAGSAAPPDRAPSSSPSSAAPSAPPSLRMAPPPPSVPAEEPRGEGARNGGRATTPHWEPLDVTASPASAAEAEREPTGSAPPSHERDEAPLADDGTPHVREIRRGALLGAQPARTPASAGTRAPERDVSYASEEDPRGDLGRPDDERSYGTHRGRGAGLFGLRRRFGFGRSERWRADEDRAAAPRQGVPTRDLPQAPGARSVPVEIEPRDPLDVARSQPEEAAPRDTIVGVADEVVEAPSATPSREDIAAVAAYLARPDVPAIVRAERVAEELALSYERVDAALDRISEESDQLSPIRAGAYMLRRGATR